MMVLQMDMPEGEIGAEAKMKLANGTLRTRVWTTG